MSEADQRLLLKAEKLNAALNNTTQIDIEKMEVQISRGSDLISILADANSGISDGELAIAASGLVAEIASLKDHLKAWCKRNECEALGERAEQLLKDNLHAAIIHDLWNLDKHELFSKKTKSGLSPRLINLRRVVSLRFENGSTSAFMLIGPSGAQSAGATLMVSADIQDENGNRLGDFIEVCENALDAWEHLISEITGLSIVM